ncbi:hypothetical protein ADL25_27290 [Streptomyces sp. NRRL F-5122]|nr:hypothetical protein ADL25_27290 [Streptomyces sp. NRRL F-5122]
MARCGASRRVRDLGRWVFRAVGATDDSGGHALICDRHRRAWGNVLLADFGPCRSGDHPCVLATTATNTTGNATAGVGAQSAYGVL